MAFYTANLLSIVGQSTAASLKIPGSIYQYVTGV